MIVTINRKRLDLASRVVTVDELRSWGSIPADHDLWAVNPAGPDRKIEGDGPIRLWNGARIFSASRCINNSTECGWGL